MKQEPQWNHMEQLSYGYECD